MTLLLGAGLAYCELGILPGDLPGGETSGALDARGAGVELTAPGSPDPDPETFSDADLAIIDEAIKKKAVSQLRSIASDLPKSLLLILADRLANSLPETSTNT